MKGADQAASRGDWRMHLRDMRTLSGLQNGAPPEDEIRRMPDRVLRAAVQNPDHSEAARAAAEAELRARSISAERWRLVVPGFIRPADLERRSDKLFFGWGRAVRVWSGRAVFALLAAMFVYALLEVRGEEQRYAEVATALAQCVASGACSQAEADAELAGLTDAAPPLWATFAALGWLLALLVWFFASALRRHPARITLLRKFNVRHLSEPLERVLSHELRPYGHIATLSDKYIRHERFGWLQTALLSLGNPLGALWFVIGLPIRFVWRLFDRSVMGPAVVLNARDYRNLAARLRDRIGLNVQAAMVSKEAFMVRTSDAWWRMTAQLLMDSSDAIVMDLSQMSEGVGWELDLIRESRAARRVVFIALWGKLEEAEAALAARGIDAVVHHYAPDGEIQRRLQFRAAMLAAMRATHHIAP
jgi:hypothetical protein